MTANIRRVLDLSDYETFWEQLLNYDFREVLDSGNSSLVLLDCTSCWWDLRTTLIIMPYVSATLGELPSGASVCFTICFFLWSERFVSQELREIRTKENLLVRGSWNDKETNETRSPSRRFCFWLWRFSPSLSLGKRLFINPVWCSRLMQLLLSFYKNAKWIVLQWNLKSRHLQKLSGRDDRIYSNITAS